MGLEGYVLYLAMIFAPGVGFGELFGLWRANGTLVERIAMAFGLGLGIDTVVLAIRTSGVSLGTLSLTGVDYGTLYFMILVGILALLSSVAFRRKLFFPARPGSNGPKANRHYGRRIPWFQRDRLLSISQHYRSPIRRLATKILPLYLSNSHQRSYS